MKIGCAITTKDRPDYLKVCLEQFQKFTPSEVGIFVNDDVNGEGVAASKNRLINKIFEEEKCDIGFLFDDDCWPKKEWLNFFLKAHEDTLQHHFLFMHPKHHKLKGVWEPYKGGPPIEIYDECSGVFMSITRKAFETVGYFDPRYKMYGYEHAGYTRRINISRLTAAPFMCLEGTDKYLHACDFTGGEEYGLTKHSSVNEETKSKWMRHNDDVYHDELNNWHKLHREYTV